MNVPIFKTERFPAIALSGGSVEPYDPETAPNVHIAKHVDGQMLTGDMVPLRENSQAEEARKKKMLEKSKPKKKAVDSDEIPDVERGHGNGELTPLLEENESEYGSA